MFGKLIKKVVKFGLGLFILAQFIPAVFRALPEPAKAIPFLFTTQEGVELVEELAVTAINAESEAISGHTVNENSRAVPDYTLGKAEPVKQEAKEKANSISAKIKSKLPHFEEATKKAGIKADFEGMDEDLLKMAEGVHEDNVAAGYYD